MVEWVTLSPGETLVWVQLGSFAPRLLPVSLQLSWQIKAKKPKQYPWKKLKIFHKKYSQLAETILFCCLLLWGHELWGPQQWRSPSGCSLWTFLVSWIIQDVTWEEKKPFFSYFYSRTDVPFFLSRSCNHPMILQICFRTSWVAPRSGAAATVSACAPVTGSRWKEKRWTSEIRATLLCLPPRTPSAFIFPLFSPQQCVIVYLRYSGNPGRAV